MYDVVVYASSLPRVADRTRKTEVLEAFAAGAQAQGARVLLQREPQIVTARLAVILGWVGTKIRGAHIQLRRDVIDHQRVSRNLIMPIDGSCFKFVDDHSQFLRYSLDGVFYNRDRYANVNSTADTWNRIQQALGLQLEPWRAQGDHVLVCLQRDGGWSMKGTDMTDWTVNTVRRLRELTSRPIVIRAHPKHRVDLSVLSDLTGVRQSLHGTALVQDLKNAWAAVFYNSSASVAAVLAGIPVFATDDDCVAWRMANPDLAQIEDPRMPAREQWIYDLSAAHWTDAESRNGAIYLHFLNLI
jgi:hypothetical protein